MLSSGHVLHGACVHRQGMADVLLNLLQLWLTSARPPQEQANKITLQQSALIEFKVLFFREGRTERVGGNRKVEKGCIRGVQREWEGRIAIDKDQDMLYKCMK